MLNWLGVRLLCYGLVFSAVTLLLLSHCWASTPSAASTGHVYTKWAGLGGVNLFCLAAVVFPVGFSAEDIGGAAYQLPNSYQGKSTTREEMMRRIKEKLVACLLSLLLFGGFLPPSPGGNLLHLLRDGALDDGHLGALRLQGLPATLLKRQ